MKTLFTLSLFIYSLTLLSQPYPEPDFVEKPMYYNLVTKQLQALERQVKPFKMEASMYNQVFHYKEAQSVFSIKKLEGVQFLIKLVNTEELDLILFLYPLIINKNERLLKINVALSSKDPAYGLIPFHYNKVAENIYLLGFDNIEPGEYVWYLKSASYLFRVE